MKKDKKGAQQFSHKELRKRRKEAGLSLAKLGSMAGISEAMLSRFETGERKLSPLALKRLQQAIKDFASGVKVGSGKSSSALPALTPEAVQRIHEKMNAWRLANKQQSAESSTFAALSIDEAENLPVEEVINRLTCEYLDQQPRNLLVLAGISDEDLRSMVAEDVVRDPRYRIADLAERHRSAGRWIEQVEAERDALRAQAKNETLKTRLETADNLINKMGEFIIRFHEAAEISLQELREKNAAIAELEDRVKELRDVWDAGVEMTLAHEKFERLRGKVTGKTEPEGE